jgi:hypothetical protein
MVNLQRIQYSKGQKTVKKLSLVPQNKALLENLVAKKYTNFNEAYGLLPFSVSQVHNITAYLYKYHLKCYPPI